MLFRKVAETYARFPSIQPSFLARDWSLPSSLVPPFLILGAAAFLLMGYLTAALVRPRNVLGDIGAGTATGTAAAVVMFAFGVGPGFVLANGVVVALPDLDTLQKGYETRQSRPVNVGEPPLAHPQDEIVKRYPDLEAFPEHERGNILMMKIVADVVIGSFTGIWMGVLTSLGFGCVIVILQTLVAGVLTRRNGIRYAFGPYVEIVLPLCVLLYALLMSIEHLQNPAESPLLPVVLATLALLAMAMTGVFGRWRWPFRVTLYAGILVAAWRLAGRDEVIEVEPGRFFHVHSGLLPWYVDVVVALALVVLVACCYDARRRHPAATAVS